MIKFMVLTDLIILCACSGGIICLFLRQTRCSLVVSSCLFCCLTKRLSCVKKTAFHTKPCDFTKSKKMSMQDGDKSVPHIYLYRIVQSHSYTSRDLRKLPPLLEGVMSLRMNHKQ